MLIIAPAIHMFGDSHWLLNGFGTKLIALCLLFQNIWKLKFTSQKGCGEFESSPTSMPTAAVTTLYFPHSLVKFCPTAVL